MPEFVLKLANAIVNGLRVVGHYLGRFLYAIGHDWSLAWVPILLLIAVAVALWALSLRKS